MNVMNVMYELCMNINLPDSLYLSFGKCMWKRKQSTNVKCKCCKAKYIEFKQCFEYLKKINSHNEYISIVPEMKRVFCKTKLSS